MQLSGSPGAMGLTRSRGTCGSPKGRCGGGGGAWQDYRDLITVTPGTCQPRLCGAGITLNIHPASELAEFAAENKAWLQVYRLPADAPDLNPAGASGRYSSGPSPTSPSPTWTAWPASSSAS